MSLQIRPAFFTRVLSRKLFPKSCLKVGGAAYTRVFTVICIGSIKGFRNYEFSKPPRVILCGLGRYDGEGMMV